MCACCSSVRRRHLCCSTDRSVLQLGSGLARRVRGSHVAEMAATLGVDVRPVARKVADGSIEDLETLQAQLQEACKEAIDAYMAQQGDEGERAFLIEEPSRRLLGMGNRVASSFQLVAVKTITRTSSLRCKYSKLDENNLAKLAPQASGEASLRLLWISTSHKSSGRLRTSSSTWPRRTLRKDGNPSSSLLRCLRPCQCRDPSWQTRSPTCTETGVRSRTSPGAVLHLQSVTLARCSSVRMSCRTRFT